MGRGRLWNCCRTSTASISSGWPMGIGTSLLLQSVYGPPQDADPLFVLTDLILDAGLDIRIIVALHHHKTVRRLLEVDTVESVADRSGRSYGEVDYVRRRLIEIEGAVAAFARRTVGTVLEDLPMSARHAILAYEQRLARQYADPPIVLRRQKLLRQDEVGFLEQFVGYALELVDRRDLVDAARERTVGDFDHQRQAELVPRPRET